MPRIKDRTGFRSGRLVAQWPVGKFPEGVVAWLCSCDCGNLIVVRGCSLKEDGKRGSRSCGCLNDERLKRLRQSDHSLHYRHGHARPGKVTGEYGSWRGARGRCNNPRDKQYHRYGGRGIKMCERWSKFENFLADMGPRPTSKHSLDRWPDNDGNYEPSNCRWATSRQQNHNRRNSRHRYMVEAADDPTLMNSSDGLKWAREFVSIARANPSMVADVEAVATWFSSAITAGRNINLAMDESIRATLTKIESILTKQVVIQ